MRELPPNVLRAIRCGPIPVLRDWRAMPTKELTRAERNMRFCEKYLRVPDGKLVGKPIKLAPFQEAFFYSVFDNPAVTRRAYLSKSRKNAKTAGIALILICYLVGPEARPNVQLASGALSRDQASVVFRYARQMIEASPDVAPLVRVVPSSKMLIGLPLGTEYRALSADGKTNHGGSPLLAILDESGQVKGPHSDFIEAIETSQGAHENPLLIVISTQAASDADWFSIQLDDAERSQDPRIVSHLYTTDTELEMDDAAGWAQSNPALGLFLNQQELIDGAIKAKRMPTSEATFRWLHLNQRVAAHNPFVSVGVWKANGAEARPLQECKRVVGGLDLSSSRDLTAFVLVGVDDDDVHHIYTYAWTPAQGLYDRCKTDRQPYDVWVNQGLLRTTPGATVDYDHVAAQIMEIVEDLEKLDTIAFDRWRIDLFKQALIRQGGTALAEKLVPMGQGFKDSSICLEALEGVLLNDRGRHGNNPVLTMAAANAIVTKDAAGGRKFDKSKATGRIDPMVALAMAEGAIGLHVAEVPKTYGMLIL